MIGPFVGYTPAHLQWMREQVHAYTRLQTEVRVTETGGLWVQVIEPGLPRTLGGVHAGVQILPPETVHSVEFAYDVVYAKAACVVARRLEFLRFPCHVGPAASTSALLAEADEAFK